MVEPQPSKLMTRVRFPLPAPAPARRDAERQLLARLMGYPVSLDQIVAHVAQSVEHFLGKEEVIGSIPIVSSSDASGVGVF
jgi:hypothetical protein